MPLKIGFVSVIRPLFKGDSPRASERSLAQVRALGQKHHAEIITANVSGNDTHASTGQPIPTFAVSNLSAAEQAARQLREQALDLLLIQHTTFSTGDLLVPLLHAAERVGLWALPERAAGRGMDGPLPLNALCGLNMTLSFLDHPQVDKQGPVKWFYGEADSGTFEQRLMPTLAALRGLKALHDARILQIGGTAPSFYGIEEHPELAGVTVDEMGLELLFEQVAKIPEADAKARAEAWLQGDTPTSLGAPREHLECSARIELALHTLAQEGNYQALAVRCWPELPERCGAMACGAVAQLGDREIPTACEGDVMGALSMLALQGISQTPAILMDLSDFDETDDSLLFWHCGNAPTAWAGRAGVRYTTHFNRDDTGVVRDMVLKPGPVSGFRLLKGGKAALVLSAEVMDTPKASFDGVRGWLSSFGWHGERVSARDVMAGVLDDRLPHHIAFGLGERSEALTELCAWLGATPLPAPAFRRTL